ncbi:hypothetical protein CASFOL_039397 [Castilleja foliolosa]|uniref:Transcription repressor n=1 Tax=Castilleja foliolosa TaxID=1961234 RepID=A0ABD3BHU6_9LAMI
MYCKGKKYSPSSSSQASIISRVFQASWFPNKLKQKVTTDPDKNLSKSQHRYHPIPISPLQSVKKEARFYSVDDEDAFWRLSFREERTEGRKSISGILVSYSDEESQIPVSGFLSFGSREIEEKLYKERIMREHEERFTSPRRKHARSRKPVERDIFPVETTYKAQMEEGFQDSPVSSSENEETSDEDYEVRRVSISERQNSRPRRVERKIRAKNNSPKQELGIDEMKKERTRLKYKETTIYDSYAEVMNSFDPQQDFRDSMVEMICEKGIRRPEELEDLLACYLTLNCDEYHDLIIKVFQQVLFELSRDDIY